MARWEPKPPQQSLQGSLDRIKTRIDQKKQELALGTRRWRADPSRTSDYYLAGLR
jgi:hypothetical protein